jgi:CheY-like chemotaxis protein
MDHILVVDDEPAIVTVVRERLEREGFAVRSVASGEEALYRREQEFRTLAENAPDNIVRVDKERCAFLLLSLRIPVAGTCRTVH